MSVGKRRGKVKQFLVQEGYLFIFAFISISCLFSYFLCNDYFLKEKGNEVLGTSSVKGIWIQSNGTDDCYGKELINADGCIDREYFNEYDQLSIQQIFLNDYGEIAFLNDQFLITGEFDSKEVVNSEIWDNLQIGSLVVKINSRQWVFEDVVWNEENSGSLISLAKTGDHYLIIIHPTMSLTGRDKQFWVFEYSVNENSFRPVYFSEDSGQKAFVESTYVEVLYKDNDIFMKFEHENPALLGNKEVLLYKYDNTLELVNIFIEEGQS